MAARNGFLSGRAIFCEISILVGLGLTVACNTSKPTSDQQLRNKAEQATEKAKQNSKEALQNARAAAADAERKVNAIAAGVKEGLHNETGPAEGSRIDLNSASRSELESLPGISAAEASRIIRHRPYTDTHQLVKEGLLSPDQFNRISDEVTVK